MLLSTHGLQHGLDRRLQQNAAVTLKAGKILQNAILVNELTPKSANASDSYVLLGVAKNKDGEPYVVEFVVNRFRNEVETVDVLYSANAKKEPAVLDAPAIAGKPLRITDSTISIAQLLDLAIEKFPDVLPESVLKRYGYTERPAGKLGESALYSLRGLSDVIAEAEQGDKLEQGNALRREKARLSDVEHQKKLLEDGGMSALKENEKKIKTLERRLQKLEGTMQPKTPKTKK